MKYDINLPTLVSVIGQELKDRDEQMLRTAVTAGNSVGGIGGALRYLNERMYQFWVYPTLLKRWITRPEHDMHDLVIMDDTNTTKQAVIEMKWFYMTIPTYEVHKDLAKLRACKCAGYMIMLGWSELGETRQQLVTFQNRFPELEADKAERFIFQTIGDKGREVEFFVAGWQIKPSPDERTVSLVKDVKPR
jgi:hypothetical protein